jgi:hypothetical protein
MLSLEQIESACADGPIPAPHPIMKSPELSFSRTYYPLGFPMEVRSNSAEVFEHFAEIWGKFDKHYDTEKLLTEVLFVEDDCGECPPEPSYRIVSSWLTSVANRDNYCVLDMESGRTSITVSRAALQHPLYVQYFLFGLAVSAISTCHATPIHAACVEFEGRGVLLCGDSGAGKSTLSYACARSGWSYISDDASYMLSRGHARRVTGNCHQVRFRPTAGKLFPELQGLAVTPRAAGKPSIELATANLPGIRGASGTDVDFVVFLKRRGAGPAEVKPYGKDAARMFMRQVLFGPDSTLSVQHAAIERMLDARLVSLHYSDLDSAIARLEMLCREHPLKG